MRHLLDSNTLIEAKNRYYNMNFCPAYWQWIDIQNRASEVSSIKMVSDELKKGNDDLAQWAKDNSNLFIDVDDKETQEAFGALVQALSQQMVHMKAGALDEFLAGADPWLIAKAMTTGAVVVTQESFNLDVKRKFLIPNVCKQFGVTWMNTFELLAKLDAKFVLP